MLETNSPMNAAAAVSVPVPTAASKPMAPVASLAPTSISDAASLPHVGDAWIYRFSDGYGKSLDYSVRVTAISGSEIRDEARAGKSRHDATFTPALELFGRRLGGLQLREFAPYLLGLGPTAPNADWQKLTIFEDSDPFTARLEGTETVTVPAGTFHAQKLVVEGKQLVVFLGTSLTPEKRNYTITVWYAPTARRFVKLTLNAAQVGGAAATVGAERDAIELVENRLQ